MNHTPAALAAGYDHAEAFCLMLYRCDGGHLERIWNSRDGVTPFVISCRECGKEAKHVEWAEDKFLPVHQPEPGSRIFVDMTSDRALAHAMAKVERWWDDPVVPMSEHPRLGPLGRDGAARALAEFQPGAPDLIEVPDSLDKPTPHEWFTSWYDDQGVEHPDVAARDLLDDLGVDGWEVTRRPIDADEERPLTGAVRIVDPARPGHQEVQIFVGRDPGSRGNAGAITLRVEEIPWFLDRMQAAGFDLLAPAFPQGRDRTGVQV